MNEERPAHTYYERMVRQAGWWGFRMQLAQTPNEFASGLALSIADPDGTKLIHRIVNAYVSERFGHKNPSRYQPNFAWRDLRLMLLRWGVGHRWKQLWGNDDAQP